MEINLTGMFLPFFHKTVTVLFVEILDAAFSKHVEPSGRVLGETTNSGFPSKVE